MTLEKFELATRVFNEARPLLEGYLPNDRAEEVEEDLASRQADATPEVMVYGVYNAGKSTVINALAGRDVASVGEVPTTDRVDHFQWRGFRIGDTPGIDAPIDHEAVTQQQLERADAVILVISTEGVVAEGKTFEAAAKLAASGRRVLLLLNNKTGYDPDSPELIEVIDRTRNNLQHAGTEHGVESIVERVAVCVVNARSAFRARFEDKAALLEHSGYPSFERRLNSFLDETNAADVAMSMRRRVAEVLEEAMTVATRQIDDDALSDQETLRNYLMEERRRIESELDSTIASGKQRLRGEVRELLEQEASGNDLQARSEEIAERQSKAVEEKLRDEVNRFADRLQRYSDGQVVAAADATGRVGGHAQLGEIPRDVADAPPFPELPSIELEPLITLVRKTRLGQKLPKGGAWVGAAVEVARGLFEYYQATKRMEAEKAREQRRIQALDDNSREFSDSWAAEIAKAVRTALEDVFAPLEEEVMRRRAELKANRNAHVEAGERMREWRHALQG